MPPKYYSWAWKSYLLILLGFSIKDALEVFQPGSQVYLYYLILRAFDPAFHIVYTQYLLRVTLTAVHLIPLFLYIYQIRFLPASFWKILFILRGIFDLIGHSYELTSLHAVYHNSPRIALTIALALFVPYIPSYIVCYWYAFRREKVLETQDT